MSKKTKIFLISNTSNFFNVFMLNHIKVLSKKYNLFICSENSKKLKKKVPKNVSLININFKRGISFYEDIISFFSILFIFLKHRPDLSISFTPKVGLIVSISSFITRIPNRYHWFTGQIWANSKGFKRTFYKFTDKLIFILSNHVFVDGISQKDFLLKEKIIKKKKSTVFHKGSICGVNISKFSLKKQNRIKLRKHYLIDNNTFIFLYLGRINKDKGIIELINAFNKIYTAHNVLLILVGSLEDLKLTELIKNNKKIKYFNFTNKPEKWYSLADILCLPSHREGFGNVVIEAASCGIPSLCSNIYGLKDAIINKKTGFFHKVGNTSDIKKKMLYVIRNKKLVKKYGISAKKRAIRDFEQSLITKKFLKFINLNISK
tara:strand:+ start:6628 stop:7755 length:1128 start_codon:yes stop_codon:yes gene_type:complete